MKVCFRADASLKMGAGHIMRCLTLADALSANGAECRFICREQPGNLISLIRNKNYPVHVLSSPEVVKGPILKEPNQILREHADWLGVSQEQDAEECLRILNNSPTDWLIVDHYGLNSRWETYLKNNYQMLVVIDDLADRRHECDFLIDQTFDRNADDYLSYVPERCIMLCGSNYALLRPEFAALRQYSLSRRTHPKLNHILISMGGVDKDNLTSEILKELEKCELPDNCTMTIVLGPTSPWLPEVSQAAKKMPWQTTVKVGVKNMAELMANSDISIGAAGSTSWERCCMGLPSIVMSLAKNQDYISGRLESSGAILVVRESIPGNLNELITYIKNTQNLKHLALKASSICDGLGVQRVISRLTNEK